MHHVQWNKGDSWIEPSFQLHWSVLYQYLAHLQTASKESLLVSCADPTHNVHSLLAAYRKDGEAIWKRFNAGKKEKLWFATERWKILSEKLDARYVEELRNNIRLLSHLVEKDDQSMISSSRKAILERYTRGYDAAVKSVRERIEEGKGDPEKQKNCTHPFDSLQGDLLHGPCICDDCGATIVA